MCALMCRMVKTILGQIESKRARELEVPDSAVNSAKPASNPGGHWLDFTDRHIADLSVLMHPLAVLSKTLCP